MATDTGPTWLAVLGAVGLGTVLSALVTAGSLISRTSRTADGTTEDGKRTRISVREIASTKRRRSTARIDASWTIIGARSGVRLT